MNMTAAEWSRVEEMFARVVDLSGDERKRFLDTTCDPLLREEVDTLLTAHDTAPAWLESSADWFSVTADDAPERIGSYRVIRAIGRGGMGQVYLVEREEQEFRQTVALKVLRRGLDTEDLLARFRTERQILARLSHTNIARLFDVGATAQGLPYFVMEYVDGVPLLEYCASRSIAERLRLFRTVCDAVQYAHRSLIVHRDIKPSNILVDTNGVVKLLDFGIARILDDDNAAHTRAEMRMLTPEYSAPEQLRGEAITTACDVHALGVLLYEMLSGSHPFRTQQGRDAVVRAVLELDPPAPSTRMAAGSLMRRQVAGDLDTIVSKALRKEPESRYSSVESFADDINRYMTGMTVQARPATMSYRVRKYVSRNAVPVGAAAALFLIVAMSSGMTVHQSRLIRAESVRVGRERDKAKQTRGFLLEMFGTTGPDQPTGDSVTARELLDRRAEMVPTAYRNDPEMRAEMLNVLAEGYDRLGVYSRAESLARAALDTRRKLFTGDHPDVAASLNVLGWILHEAGKEAEADSLLNASVAMGRRVYGAAANGDFARSLNDLGVVREASADYPEATSLYREAIAMHDRAPGADNDGAAVTTSNLSVVLYRQGDLEGAVAMGRDALARLVKTIGPDNQRTTIVQSNLAAMQSQLGDHAGAAQQHRDLVAKRTRLFGPRNAAVAFSMSMLANELMLMDSLNTANTMVNEALAIMRDAHASPAQIASSLRVLGDVRHKMGDNRGALTHYADALSLTRSALGPGHRDVPTLLTRSAVAYEALGDSALAEKSYHEAITAAIAAKAGKRAVGIELSLADLLLREGKRDAAALELDAAERTMKTDPAASSDSLVRLARRLHSTLGAANTPRH